MTQARSEIVEAMAREMCRAVHPCKSMVAEIMTDATYLSGREGDAAALTLAGQFRIEAEAALDIALKAAAEIAFDARTYAEFCAYEKRQSGRDDNKECAEAQIAWRIRDAILALTSEGKDNGQ